MRFYSTNLKAPYVSFKDAVVNGLAPDGGLYMPEKITPINSSFFDSLPFLTLHQIASSVIAQFLSPEFTSVDLDFITKKAFNFPSPLNPISENLSVLELFHGETLAFKDFGARFLAEVLEMLLPEIKREVLILVATSGDTGSAVAKAFYKRRGINVVLLFPKGKVSKLQEAQLTALGENITALEVEGTFDDCQSLVKKALTDEALRASFFLSSANSINIARLLPQAVYYFAAVSELMKKSNWSSSPIIVSVPSGNFGNLTAGMIARRLGLPVQRFIAITNDNRSVPAFFETELFSPKPTIQTISNAMDVGRPSNFDRMIALEKLKGFALLSIWERKEALLKLRDYISAYSVSESETKMAMKTLYEKFHYVACPHTAVGFKGMMNEFVHYENDVNYIVLATAHPAKFKSVVDAVLGTDIELPNELKNAVENCKPPIQIQTDFEELKNTLLRLK